MFLIHGLMSDNLVLCRKVYRDISAVDELLLYQENVQDREMASGLRQALKDWLALHDPYHLLEKSHNDFQEGIGE